MPGEFTASSFPELPPPALDGYEFGYRVGLVLGRFHTTGDVGENNGDDDAGFEFAGLMMEWGAGLLANPDIERPPTWGDMHPVRSEFERGLVRFTEGCHAGAVEGGYDDANAWKTAAHATVDLLAQLAFQVLTGDHGKPPTPPRD